MIGFLLDAWKKTVDVQQHFNQIEMDIRKSAVTLILAAVGAAGFASDKHLTFSLHERSWPVAAGILGAAAIAWSLFGCVDYYWYHRLLKGAVKHGMELEKALRARGVPVELTDCIGRESPVEIGSWKLRSNGKIKAFYAVIFVLIALATCGIAQSQDAPIAQTKTAPAGH